MALSAAFLAVLGPGLLAGLSDDDPAGITTYALLGTDFGYRLLWVIPAATLLLTVFHLLAVEVGAVTSLGFVALVRERWGRAAGHVAMPHVPLDHAGWMAVAATVGTTLAPWGLAFIQSYAVDKRIRQADLPLERVEVVVGSLLTGVIGLAIAVACAATLHAAGIPADSADDVAVSLEPLAGRFATLVFGGGLLGAAVLAAAVVPIATAYSVSEGIGAPASLSLDAHRFHAFYAVFVGLTVAAVSVVAIPGLPLLPLMVATQVVNAVLLPLHLVALLVLAVDPIVADRATIGAGMLWAGWLGVAAVVASVVALAVT